MMFSKALIFLSLITLMNYEIKYPFLQARPPNSNIYADSSTIGNKNISVIERTPNLAYTVRNLEELEERSEFIFKAKLNRNLKNLVDNDINESGEIHSSLGMTLSSFHILEVYKGDIKPNSDIDILEPFYRDESTIDELRKDNHGNLVSKKNTIHVLYFYIPCTTESEYILFLNEPEENIYEITLLDKGKYTVPKNNIRYSNIDDMTPEVLEVSKISPIEYSREYRRIYMEVIKKYVDKS